MLQSPLGECVTIKNLPLPLPKSQKGLCDCENLMEFLEVNLRVSPRLKQPGVFPLTPVHTQLPAIHQNYHDVFLPVYDSSRSAPACRALRISLENVQVRIKTDMAHIWKRISI